MEEILSRYSKPIVHLRQQHKNRRLGLIFGAGISKELLFPDWNELVKRIAWHPLVAANEMYDSAQKWSSTTAITQILFQHFKRKRLKELESEYADETVTYREKKVLADWREAVHDVLYKNALVNRKDMVRKHQYLNAFIPLIKKTEVTVTYNFDDTLEYMLSSSEGGGSKEKGRAYQAVWNPHMQFREDTAVIYHPNGYLPADKNLNQSEKLVFSEESFSDQLIGSMSGRLSTLLHLFTKKTCLFVGLSLEDNTLKHLLRQASSISPGNYHYFIRYTNGNKELTSDEKNAIYNSNFEVYNLITLFLNGSEIAGLAKLVDFDNEEFQNLAAIAGVEIKFLYYLVGTVGSGKSTILSHFGNLINYEEWMEDRLPELSKPFSELSETEESKVNNWVDRQFFLKNKSIMNEKEGIVLVDRSPLDPITFTQSEKDMQRRAELMASAIAPGDSNYKIESGHILLLKANPSDLVGRLLSKRKTNWERKALHGLQESALNMYGELGTRQVENIDRTIPEVVSDIAKIIHIDEYEPADLNGKLMSIIGMEL